jgi:pimeloyl-ACP methyl ester carboxylesterase
VRDFGLAPKVAELAAVVEQTGSPAQLLAVSEAGPVAIALAAERPELVRRLVLFGTYAAGPAVFTNLELRQHMVGLVRAHWGLGSRLLADLYRPGASDEASRHLARVLRDSADREVAAGYLESCFEADVSALLPAVRVPTLVLHYRGDRLIPFRGGQELAAALPDAAFLPLGGTWHLPDVADLDRIAGAIADFVEAAG